MAYMGTEPEDRCPRSPFRPFRPQREEVCGPPSILNSSLPRNGRNDMRRHNIFLSNELQSYAVPGTA